MTAITLSEKPMETEKHVIYEIKYGRRI